MAKVAELECELGQMLKEAETASRNGVETVERLIGIAQLQPELQQGRDKAAAKSAVWEKEPFVVSFKHKEPGTCTAHAGIHVEPPFDCSRAQELKYEAVRCELEAERKAAAKEVAIQRNARMAAEAKAAELEREVPLSLYCLQTAEETIQQEVEAARAELHAVMEAASAEKKRAQEMEVGKIQAEEEYAQVRAEWDKERRAALAAAEEAGTQRSAREAAEVKAAELECELGRVWGEAETARREGVEAAESAARQMDGLRAAEASVRLEVESLQSVIARLKQELADAQEECVEIRAKQDEEWNALEARNKELLDGPKSVTDVSVAGVEAKQREEQLGCELRDMGSQVKELEHESEQQTKWAEATQDGAGMEEHEAARAELHAVMEAASAEKKRAQEMEVGKIQAEEEYAQVRAEWDKERRAALAAAEEAGTQRSAREAAEVKAAELECELGRVWGEAETARREGVEAAESAARQMDGLRAAEASVRLEVESLQSVIARLKQELADAQEECVEIRAKQDEEWNALEARNKELLDGPKSVTDVSVAGVEAKQREEQLGCELRDMGSQVKELEHESERQTKWAEAAQDRADMELELMNGQERTNDLLTAVSPSHDKDYDLQSESKGLNKEVQ